MPGKASPGVSCVILAAGHGTRMKSSTPKVLHTLYGKPMLQYVVEAAGRLRPERIVVVAGENRSAISDSLGGGQGTIFATQREQKGTAHALGSAVSSLKGFNGTVIVMNGDTPLVRPATLRKFISLHRRQRNSVSLLSFIAENPDSYGRVVRDESGAPISVVEQKDASPKERAVKEVNSGVYAIETSALPFIKSIKLNVKKKEYYLTDIVALAVEEGKRTGVYCIGEEEEFLGVNTRQELSRARTVIQRRITKELFEKGVSFIDADSALIAPSVKIGTDTVVYPNVYLEGKTTIGKGCVIYPNVHITDSTIRDDAIIKDSSVIEKSFIGKGAQVGPFAHVRPGSRIGPSAKIGNFVELKKSTVGKGTKAMHLSYLGDSTIGNDANIGAGTITCNYDGAKKHMTVIGNNVFVGSDTQLVAPVKLGKGSYIGAGSTITKNVPPDSLSLSRSSQKTVKGWPSRKKKR
jgi:bifunctional UDP-N-acetylglucosamine pyrophosphorylase/glucosamine-1-phosphate N-acetyltransferase